MKLSRYFGSFKAIAKLYYTIILFLLILVVKNMRENQVGKFMQVMFLCTLITRYLRIGRLSKQIGRHAIVVLLNRPHFDRQKTRDVVVLGSWISSFFSCLADSKRSLG